MGRHRVAASIVVLLPLLASVAVAVFAAPPRAPDPYCVHVQAMLDSATATPSDPQTFTSEAGMATYSAPADLRTQWDTLMEWTSAIVGADGWVAPPPGAQGALLAVVRDATPRCGWDDR